MAPLEVLQPSNIPNARGDQNSTTVTEPHGLGQEIGYETIVVEDPEQIFSRLYSRTQPSCSGLKSRVVTTGTHCLSCPDNDQSTAGPPVIHTSCSSPHDTGLPPTLTSIFPREQNSNPVSQLLGNPNPTNVGKVSTTLDVQTTFTTAGVFVTDVTTTFPNGQTTGTTITTATTRTIATHTVVITQPGSTSPSNGPSKAIIGGVIGAAFFVISSLVVLLILRYKHRQKATAPDLSSGVPHPFEALIQNSEGQAAQTLRPPITPQPFVDSSPQINLPIKQETIRTALPNSLSCNDQGNEGQNTDPFRDPVNEEARGVTDALDRLQQLTTQLEAELCQLSDLGQSGQLSTEDHVRLEEIRHITGLSIPFNPTHRHLLVSMVDSVASYLTGPPSYHSG